MTMRICNLIAVKRNVRLAGVKTRTPKSILASIHNEKRLFGIVLN